MNAGVDDAHGSRVLAMARVLDDVEIGKVRGVPRDIVDLHCERRRGRPGAPFDYAVAEASTSWR